MMHLKGEDCFYSKTDFDNYVNHIDNQPRIWELLIHDSAQLKCSTYYTKS